MNAANLNETLDQIEYELMFLGNGEIVQACNNVIGNLRKNSQSIIPEETDIRLAQLWSTVESLKSGRAITRKKLEEMNKEYPTLKIFDWIENENHVTNSSVTVNEEVINGNIKILEKILNSVKYNDLETIRKSIDSVVESYMAQGYQVENFDMEIVEMQYELIRKYLQEGKIEEATEYVKKFDTDVKHFEFDMKKFVLSKMQKIMKEYTKDISDKLKDEEIIELNMPEETLIALIDYVSRRKDIDVTNLSLWKTMIELETHTFFEIQPAQNEKSSIKKEKEKIKDDEKNGIIVIRYDENAPGKTNKKDIKRLYKKLKASKRWYSKNKSIKVVFEDGITQLDETIFKGWEALEEVDLSRTQITSIPANCFEGSGLKRIDLPSTLEDIGVGAFANTLNLQDIDLGNTQVTNVSDNCFNGSGVKNINLPSTVKNLGVNAFYKTVNLESVNLSETQVKNIANGCFCESGINSIYFPTTLENIGAGAFNKTSRLVSIDLSKTQVKNISEFCFCRSGINNIELPSTLENIGQRAFQRTSKLLSIDLSKTQVKNISEFCFCESGINNIELPSTLENIDMSAFIRTLKLESIDLSKTQVKNISDGCFYESGINSIEFPSTLKNIGISAFQKTSNLEIIDLSQSKIKNIPKDCFNESGVKKIVFPNTLEKIEVFNVLPKLEEADLSKTQITSIPDNCFNGSGIKKIDLPNTLEEIGEKAFARTVKLEGIDLSKTQITSIPANCFNGSGIKKIDLPNTLEKITPYAFNETPKLESIDLSKTQIRNLTQCFSGSGIKKISLPNVLVQLSNYAFSGSAIREIICNNQWKQNLKNNSDFKYDYKIKEYQETNVERDNRISRDNVTLAKERKTTDQSDEFGDI